MVRKANSNSTIKDKDPTTHLLVIRLSAMGDVALCVPVLLAFLKQHPQVKLTMLSKAFLAPLFRGIPNLQFKEAAVKSRHKGVGGLYKLFLELRKEKLTAVADLHAVIRSQVIGGFFKTVGVKVATLKKDRRAKKTLTRPKNKQFKPLLSSQERYAQVFEKLGYPIDLSSPQFLEQRIISSEVTERIGKKSQKWIGFAPFAAHEGKKYPEHLAEKVISALAVLDHKVFLFGGGAEEVKALEIMASKHQNCSNLAGEFSFSEELDIISHLDLMIAMDSGNGHLAGLFDIPVITVWGVTHPYLGFQVYNQPDENQLIPDREQFPLIPTSVYGNKMPKGYEKAIASISPQIIVDQAKNLLIN